MAIAGFILSGYVTKEYEIRFKRPYPVDVFGQFKHRDLRLLAIGVGAVAGHPYAAMLAVGLLGHVCVFGILMRGWKLSAPESEKKYRPESGLGKDS